VIRVAVVDDQALVRSGFTVLLRSAPDIEVVGEAADGREAIELVERERPDVVLMDIRMPEMNGLEATRQILGDGSSTRVLILTTFDLDEYVYEALRAGASGFLLKDTLPDELLSAVRVVAGGEALLAPKITTRLIADFVFREAESSPNGSADSPAQTAKDHPDLEPLTDREREVLVAVARGLSNAEIADELHMSHATAKTHVSRLLTKLHARDRAQLVVAAYEAEIVTAGSSTPDGSSGS
jgi:DNA-binding NarL/FixJ family response regulator